MTRIIRGKAAVSAYLSSRGGPTSFAGYLTPEQAKAAGDTRKQGELRRLASARPLRCVNCDNMAWRYGGTGMCFSCTTGESDASKDYELVSTWTPRKEQRKQTSVFKDHHDL